MNTGPLRVEALRHPEAVCAALLGAGYVEPALVHAIRPLGLNQRIDVPVVACRVTRNTAFDVLVRLFLLGFRVSTPALSDALSPNVLDELIAAGVLAATADGVKARAKLLPYQDLYLVADFGTEITGTPCPPDHVVGVGAASVTLASLTIRRSYNRTLDVGAGAGIQSLLAARHSRAVVATDTNPRALNYLRFNASLNGFDHITCRQGSFFEPVERERFDLVVSNPPFVISPDSRFMFRDGGLGGDAVSETVVRQAAHHLEEGGYAVVLINWYHATADDWAERPQQWVADGGCDAWLLCLDDEDALTYAARWLAPLAEDSGQQEAALRDWLSYYAHAGISRIAAGAVVLHRSGRRPNWFRSDRLDGGLHVNTCGDQIALIMEAESFLHARPLDDDLLASRFEACPDVWMDHGLRLKDGEWVLEFSRLRHTQGFSFAGNADVMALMLLARCDGRASLASIVQRIRADMSPAEAPPVDAFVGLTRRLLRSGHLLPCDR